MAADPLDLIDDVRRATDRLLATARSLDDDAVAAPSGLPKWTRGHVLTHIARNADGLVNLLTWARTGVRTPQYPSAEQRNAEIEAGAQRSASELLADLTAASARFIATTDAMPPPAWTATVTWLSGRSGPAARVVWARLSEVEIHHVDLAAGYRPADWPLPFVLRTLRMAVDRWGDDTPGPRVVVRAPEVGHDLIIGRGSTGIDAGMPVITGPAWGAAAWLTGRSTGAGLTVDPPGSLPAVPPWG